MPVAIWILYFFCLFHFILQRDLFIYIFIYYFCLISVSFFVLKHNFSPCDALKRFLTNLTGAGNWGRSSVTDTLTMESGWSLQLHPSIHGVFKIPGAPALTPPFQNKRVLPREIQHLGPHNTKQLSWELRRKHALWVPGWVHRGHHNPVTPTGWCEREQCTLSRCWEPEGGLRFLCLSDNAGSRGSQIKVLASFIPSEGFTVWQLLVAIHLLLLVFIHLYAFVNTFVLVYIYFIYL